jgi:hypothetical protein
LLGQIHVLEDVVDEVLIAQIGFLLEVLIEMEITIVHYALGLVYLFHDELAAFEYVQLDLAVLLALSILHVLVAVDQRVQLHLHPFHNSVHDVRLVPLLF